MRKQYGPDLKRRQIPIARCPDCRGRGVTAGLFHELPCASCNATGWVAHATGEALPLEEIVFTLNHRLLHLEQQLATLQRTQTTQENNRRGAGRSHLTGD